MDAFDDRIVRLIIDTENGLKSFEDLKINAIGTRFANDICNECEITIVNLDRETRDYLLTETSPYITKGKRRNPKRCYLDIGRKSTGTFRFFSGEVVAGIITQPPDIGLTLKSLTGAYMLYAMLSVNHAKNTNLSEIAKQVAKNINASLVFQAKDKNIGNYSYTGSAYGQVQKLNEMGDVNAFLDNDTLYVKDKDKPLNGNVRVLNASNGMIGIPQVTEQGVSVKMLADNTVQLGGSIKIESELNPAANGTFTIYRLTFDVSNRDNNFYYDVECKWML